MEIEMEEIIVDEELEIEDVELDVIKEYSGDGTAIKEVHIGAEEPIDEEVIWIDPTEEDDKIPTKTSELENDSGFITEIPDIPTKVSELENDSKYITMNDVDSIDFYTKSLPQISENYSTATGINLQDNTIHRFMNIMYGITLNLPIEINDLFQCEVVFKSGTTPTSITYDESIKWSGDDIKDNRFVPLTNKTYNILIWNDYFNINAVVRGV